MQNINIVLIIIAVTELMVIIISYRILREKTDSLKSLRAQHEELVNLYQQMIKQFDLTSLQINIDSLKKSHEKFVEKFDSYDALKQEYDNQIRLFDTHYLALKHDKENLEEKLSFYTKSNKWEREQIMGNVSSCFSLSGSIMTPYESRIYFCIKNYLSVYDGTPAEYYIFPQVSMHCFINRMSNYESEQRMQSLEKVLSIPKEQLKRQMLYIYGNKSIDFLICQSRPSEKKYKDTCWYEYVPLLCIEIDGPSHNDIKQQNRDKIKNELLEGINLKLIRFTINENNSSINYDKLKKLIRDNLQLPE